MWHDRCLEVELESGAESELSMKTSKETEYGAARRNDPMATALVIRAFARPAGQVMRSMTETLLEIGAKGGLGKRSAKRGRRK